MPGNAPSALTFPKSKSSLWDPSPAGSLVGLHLCYYRNPHLVVLEKVLRLAHLHTVRVNRPSSYCFLLGSISVDQDEEGVTLTLDRFDPGRAQPGSRVPSLLLPGDVVVPVEMVLHGNPNQVARPADLKVTFKALQQACSGAEVVDLSQLLGVRGQVISSQQGDQLGFSLRWLAATCATSFDVVGVRALPIIPTALARNLSSPGALHRGAPHQGLKHQRGFLSMDQTRKLLLLLESDPKACTLPLVGVSSLHQRVLSEQGWFLLVVFPWVSSQAQFYQCRCAGQRSGDLDYQLLSGSHDSTLFKHVEPAEGHGLQCDLAPDGTMQADLLGGPTLSSLLGTTVDQDSGVEDEDLSPRPSPNPHVHKQTRRVQPSVPELSLLLDAADVPATPQAPPLHSTPSVPLSQSREDFWTSRTPPTLILPPPGPECTSAPPGPSCGPRSSPHTRSATLPCSGALPSDAYQILMAQERQLRLLQSQIQMLLDTQELRGASGADSPVLGESASMFFNASTDQQDILPTLQLQVDSRLQASLSDQDTPARTSSSSSSYFDHAPSTSYYDHAPSYRKQEVSDGDEEQQVVRRDPRSIPGQEASAGACITSGQTQTSRDLSLAQTPRDLSLAQTPRGLSQTQTPRDLSLAQTPRDLSLAQTPRGLSQTQTPRGLSLAQTPRDLSLAQTPRGLSKIQTPRGLSQTQTPRGLSQTQTQRDLSLAQTPGDLSLAQMPGDLSLAQTPGDLSLAQTPRDPLLPGRSVDLSLEANAIALRYLSDSQLSRLSVSSTAALGCPGRNVLSCSNMSLVTRGYMRSPESSLPQSQLIRDLQPKLRLLAQSSRTKDGQRVQQGVQQRVSAGPSLAAGSVGNFLDPRDLPLEPRCVYRNQNPEDQPLGPTEEPEKAPGSTNPRVLELSNANGHFALSLYKQLAKNTSTDTNIFMSPISISTAFAMTKLGACDRTLDQIMDVFGFNTITEKTSDQVHFFFAKLNCRLYRKKDKSTELVSANRLFGEQTLAFNQTYQNISEIVYGARLMPLNFKGNPKDSRLTINQWVSNQTEDRIQDVLPEGAIDFNTVLILVNTIYFKGQWKSKFDKDNVFQTDFTVSESRTCSVSMMFQEHKFQYARFQDDQVQVLELPYRGDDITMVIVLPARDTPLAQVEETLDLQKLTGWLDGLQETTVSVQIPRFRVDGSFSLKARLQAMGLTDLFTPQASLPGILEKEAELYISDAFHKAFLEVNEEGSEAAAATVVLAVGRSFNLNRELFVADRPFLIFIREKSINTLVFTGRVADPC
ncbi:hypothetical protein NHX12_032791 [Muraenolepis orangiensis]|uniref:Antithrombin-III n=1 Tax=Muraenolepis orangiensis TaxID=630683 RepID=A0A9Q0IFR7_9TELE|nr:hypothetical protein NHX12_032791 [Muraenolepis orangiensis]